MKKAKGPPFENNLRQRVPPMVLKFEISRAKGGPFTVIFFQRGYPFEISKNEDFGKIFCCNFSKNSEILRIFLRFQLSKCILTWIHRE